MYLNYKMRIEFKSVKAFDGLIGIDLILAPEMPL